jgi:hypothetical protein
MKFSQFLYDERGNLRSEDQFRKKLVKEGKDPDDADYSDLVSGASEVWKSEKVIKDFLKKHKSKLIMNINLNL